MFTMETEALNTLRTFAACFQHPTDSMTDFWAHPLSDPLLASLVSCAIVSTYCFVGGIITGNYSKVDQLWSILPAYYVILFAAARGFKDIRLDIMAFIISVWGARLTFNFARKGGYNGEEDYRWPILRKTWPLTNPIMWQLFNFFFIALYQNVLLLLISLPAYTAYMHGENIAFGNSPWDFAGAILVLLFIAMETVADQQQWEFQTEKHSQKSGRAKRSGDFKHGFLTQGLFAYSRHPNFFAEQSIWWSLYLFSVAVTDQPLHWTVIGAFLLSLLFQGSTSFTETISLQKYPSYRIYQMTTSRLIPWIPGPSIDDMSH